MTSPRSPRSSFNPPPSSPQLPAGSAPPSAAELAESSAMTLAVVGRGEEKVRGPGGGSSHEGARVRARAGPHAPLTSAAAWGPVSARTWAAVWGTGWVEAWARVRVSPWAAESGPEWAALTAGQTACSTEAETAESSARGSALGLELESGQRKAAASAPVTELRGSGEGWVREGRGGPGEGTSGVRKAWPGSGRRVRVRALGMPGSGRRTRHGQGPGARQASQGWGPAWPVKGSGWARSAWPASRRAPGMARVKAYTCDRARPCLERRRC